MSNMGRRLSKGMAQVQKKIWKDFINQATATAEEFRPGDVKDHLTLEIMRGESYVMAKSDDPVYWKYVYEGGLVGATPESVFHDLLEELGIEPDDHIVVKKVKVMLPSIHLLYCLLT